MQVQSMRNRAFLPAAPARPAAEAEAEIRDGFSPGWKSAALGGAVLLGTPALALASTAPNASGMGAAVSALPSNVFWVGGAAAALGFLVGSVPKNDGWGFDGAQAIAWASGAGLVAGGAAAALQGSLGAGLGSAGLGLAIAGLHYLSQERPTVSSVKLEAGLNSFPGESEKDQFKAARKAFDRASFESHGRYATRGRIEWEFDERGADSNFISSLREGCQYASPETFDILVMLTRGLGAADGKPAVVVVRGGEQLRQLEFGSEALRLADGTEVPYKSMRAGVGYAWR